ncbi:hypothetical protein [Fibrella aquatilis]|uniref:Uncharacterized protein n=1 Tax=Fibrella aquatilis TaxID=2817059 RepID=A0A939G5C3_9BACT|nr:hypothetical protein [Fibrella aquatilis]MBO0930512.1 hypothetical protein [Fibrella aquatilis]
MQHFINSDQQEPRRIGPLGHHLREPPDRFERLAGGKEQVDDVKQALGYGFAE